MQTRHLLKTLPLLIAAGFASAAFAADIKLGAAEALTGPAAKYGVASGTASSWPPMKSTPRAASTATRSRS